MRTPIAPQQTTVLPLANADVSVAVLSAQRQTKRVHGLGQCLMTLVAHTKGYAADIAEGELVAQFQSTKRATWDTHACIVLNVRDVVRSNPGQHGYLGSGAAPWETAEHPW